MINKVELILKLDNTFFILFSRHAYLIFTLKIQLQIQQPQFTNK